MKPTTGGGPMVIIYSANLAGMRAKVVQAGGIVTRDIYAFPDGKRFHFKDPSGNELSVWSDK